MALPYLHMCFRRQLKIITALAFSVAALLAATQSHLAVITVPVANLYSSPSEDVDVVSQAILGSSVEVLEEHAGWEKVRTNDQYTGWMQTSDARDETAEPDYAASGRIAQVSSLTANLYRETNVTL